MSLLAQEEIDTLLQIADELRQARVKGDWKEVHRIEEMARSLVVNLKEYSRRLNTNHVAFGKKT